MARRARRDFLPIDLGIDSLAVSGSSNSSWLPLEGADTLTLDFKLVRNAATDVSFFVDVTNDYIGTGPNYFALQTQSAAATGIVTYIRYQHLHVVSGTASTQTWTVTISNLVHAFIRLNTVAGTASTATDLLTCWAHIGSLGGM